MGVKQWCTTKCQLKPVSANAVSGAQASGKTIARSKTTLRGHSKAFCEPTQLSPSCTERLDQQATGEMDEVGRESSRHRVAKYFQRPISNAWQLIALLLALLCSRIYKRFDFTESYFTIHSFFTPKNSDTIISYARKVLKIFNCHLNCKREFTMITGKT